MKHNLRSKIRKTGEKISSIKRVLLWNILYLQKCHKWSYQYSSLSLLNP